MELPRHSPQPFTHDARPMFQTRRIRASDSVYAFSSSFSYGRQYSAHYIFVYTHLFLIMVMIFLFSILQNSEISTNWTCCRSLVRGHLVSERRTRGEKHDTKNNTRIVLLNYPLSFGWPRVIRGMFTLPVDHIETCLAHHLRAVLNVA